jgi:small-conductance mechanosensitive channel
MEQIQNILNTKLFQIGESVFTVFSIVMLVLVPILVVILSKMIQNAIVKGLGRITQMDVGTRSTVGTIIYYIVLVSGLVMAVSTAGLNTQSLAIFSGGIGLGLGLGLQDIAKNFISGIIMLVTKTVKKDDVISFGDMAGQVEHIGSYSTSMRTIQDAVVIVPNSQILDNQFVNWTHNRRLRMLEIPVGVHYASDLDVVMSCLEDAAKSNPWVKDQPAPQIILTEFADSSINFLARVWTTEVLYHMKVISKFNLDVAKSFQERGVTIPYPQRDVHLIPPPSETE